MEIAKVALTTSSSSTATLAVLPCITFSSSPDSDKTYFVWCHTTGVTTLKVFADWKILRGCFGKYTSDLIWELENKQIVLGEIQRCSKRSVDITCLQMQTAEFDKCTTAKPSNPYIGSAQIHANPWGPLLSHAYVGTFCHWDNHSHWKRWLIIIILMIKLCQIY